MHIFPNTLTKKMLLFTAALGSICLLSGCGNNDAPVLESEQAELGVTGAISRYHYLLQQPYGHSLTNAGFLIGIEKMPRDATGFLVQEPGQEAAEGFDTTRLLRPTATSQEVSSADVAAQTDRFERILDDGKVMVVSHLVEYRTDATGARILPELLYATYTQTGFGTEDRACGAAAVTRAYAGGWDALDCLEQQIDRALSDAMDAGQPYSHIFLLSMGWNNDQPESIERYNSLIAQTAKAARTSDVQSNVSFNPLIVGFTWPSVWGGTSAFDLMNRALHVGSYPAKSDDADEIGFGIANHVMNSLLPRIEKKHQIRTVAIGHSMGARLLTRAYYSGHMLRAQERRDEGAEPLFIGLQPAFSANRYRADHIPWLTLGNIIPREGGPYQESRPNVVLTWSDNDKANPLARLLTGARHLGGTPGFQAAEEINKDLTALSGDPLDERFRLLSWPGQAAQLRGTCFADDRVLLLDATQVVGDHGDIQTADIGELIWQMMNCW